jgi:hypothetical protein
MNETNTFLQIKIQAGIPALIYGNAKIQISFDICILAFLYSKIPDSKLRDDSIAKQ